jgi:chemotaxis protein MotB
MQPRQRVLALCLAAGLTGCVTLDSYDSLLKHSQDLQAQLDQSKQSKATVVAQNTDLEATAADLTNQSVVLAVQKQGLEKRNAALEDQAADNSQLVADLSDEINSGDLTIEQYRNMVTVEMSDQILFDSAKADLGGKGQALLLRLAKLFAKNDKIVRVVGHTDDVKMGPNAKFDTNWELSTARAVTVVRFLQHQGGLDPTRLIAAGRGKWMPMVPNDSVENRQKNRRIEITLLDRSLVDGLSAK